ncbi:MAG: AbiH family protein, partial [Thiothrix sp.]
IKRGYMDLYIIGNGFDIAHNLPTKYWDFRNFLDQVYPEFLNQFEEAYDIYPGMSTITKQNLLWNQFEG